jgi:hypothetical protein
MARPIARMLLRSDVSRWVLGITRDRACAGERQTCSAVAQKARTQAFLIFMPQSPETSSRLDIEDLRAPFQSDRPEPLAAYSVRLRE